MQYVHIILLASSTALFSVAQACGCHNPGDGCRDEVSTGICCKGLGGMSGNDCAASSMSNKLSTFAQCCIGRGKGLRSDCNFPIAWNKKKRLVDGVMFAEWVHEAEDMLVKRNVGLKENEEQELPEDDLTGRRK